MIRFDCFMMIRNFFSFQNSGLEVAVFTDLEMFNYRKKEGLALIYIEIYRTLKK